MFLYRYCLRSLEDCVAARCGPLKVGEQGVYEATPHEGPSRRYFFQASYSDATWHTAVGKATGTCESLGRGTGAPRGVLPLVPSRSYDQV